MEPDDKSGTAKLIEVMSCAIVGATPNPFIDLDKVTKALQESLQDMIYTFDKPPDNIAFFHEGGKQYASYVNDRQETRTFYLSEGRWAYANNDKTCFVGQGSMNETALKTQYEAYLAKMVVT